MQLLTIHDIERVPGTTKMWRTTRTILIAAIYRGQQIEAQVPVGFPFQFSWLWPLRVLAHPNRLHNAVFAFWHDVALSMLADADGAPLDRRWCAAWAEERARASFGRRRWWKLRRNRIAARIWTHDMAAFGRFFHGARQLNQLS